MDQLKSKIKKHQKVLSEYVRKMAQERNEALGNQMTYQAIIDLVGNHFQLVRIGWHEHRYLYTVLIHFDINSETGNIWVQQNNTEILLDEDLKEYGIPKSSIVIGFRPEGIRSYAGFAVA
ncbi:MAG: XisI protein [Spirosomaceae bacterium]|jgi:hypothetical protein|nr:XisI protein [Spirosomataceae bacterium]